MALDGVPWFIGGDAEHGPDVARQLAYLASSGREGVVAPGDLKVQALPVPGAGAQVAAGGASVLNRTASQQSYTARNATADLTSVKFAATGSGSGRSDLVVLLVENPYVDGSAQVPDDPALGPYNRFAVIPGVPAGTTDLHAIAQYAGMSAIELARVDIPKSTQTITNAMITDLRTMVKPREQRVLARGTLVDGSITLTGAAYQAFPQNPITGIEVPPWATHAVIRMDTTVRFVSGDGYGNVQSFLHVGTVDSTTLYSDFILDSSVGGGAYRQPFISPSDGYWPVPASLRGKKATLMTRIKGRATGTISTGTTDYYFADITFTERPS